MTIQKRISLLFFSATVFGLILLNISVFYFISNFTFEDFFDRLQARVKLVTQINLYPNENSSAIAEVRNKYLEKLPEERDYVLKLSGSPKLISDKPIDVPDSFFEDVYKNKKGRYRKDNTFYAGSLVNKGKDAYLVIVSAADPYGFKEVEELKKVLLISFLVCIVLSFIAAKVLSSYILRPVRAIIKSVQNISANNLHSRLAEVKGTDEIAELSLTFNNMLTRLETAFETQNNFVSNASHELRTPLSIISGETELLLHNENLHPDLKNAVKTIYGETEKLSQILTSLIGLAQSGFDGKKQNWQRVRVDELVFDVISSVKKILPESSIDFDIASLPTDESCLWTEGNVNLLHLAVSNIVLNACKYSNNKLVQVKIVSQNSKIIISVLDKGIGIPLSDQQHIFEPFFRASNTSEFEGYGIGLPLTLNIIRLHKGSIGILSEEKVGTEMQILLPAC